MNNAAKLNHEEMLPGRIVRIKDGNLIIEALIEAKKDAGYEGRVLHVLTAAGDLAESSNYKLEDKITFSAAQVDSLKDTI